MMLANGASWVRADTRLFPLISISEQYDSNVFYAPESLLAPGLKAQDFVTFVNPQLLLVHTAPRFAGSLSVGGVIGKYVNNPDLDFAGFNAATSLNFSQMAQRISRRFTGLAVTGAYQYTPSASAFGGGGVGFGGIGFGTTGTVASGAIGPFDSGLVANRVKITSYSASATGGYALTPLTNLQFGYTYSAISFGGQFGIANEAQQNQLINTTTHLATTGVNTRISRNDVLTAAYTYSTFQQSAAIESFSTHTATGTWSRQWIRELGTSVTGGVSLLEPFDDLSTGTPQAVPAKLAPSVGASMTWASTSSILRSAGEGAGVFSEAGGLGSLPGLAGSVRPGTALQRGRYAVSVSYNYGIFPSYVAQAGPIQTHVFGARASLGLTDRMTGQLGLNFARNIGSYGGTQSPVFAFDTYGTTEGLTYLVTPNLQASLTHMWLNFLDKSPNPALIYGNNPAYEFSKHMVMLSLSYVYTPTHGFFKSGGLSGASTQSGTGFPSSGSSQGAGSSTP